MKKSLNWIILAGLVYSFVEFLSFSFLVILSKYRNIDYEPIDSISTKHVKILNNFIERKAGYVAFSSSLGWTVKKNGGSKLYQANSIGIRGDQEYSFSPRPSIRRIMTFGDSFTHCDNVKNNETWQAFMEQENPNLEVMNFGVGGYGLDQTYLRYMELGSQYESNIVFIGFMSENIYRNVNTYRPFYSSKTSLPFTKPRFVFQDDQLTQMPNIMQSSTDYKSLIFESSSTLADLGENDYYYQKKYKKSKLDWSPTLRLIKVATFEIKRSFGDDGIVSLGQYNTNSEAYVITKHLFDIFHSEILSNGSTPIILIFPNKDDIINYRTQNSKRYMPLLTYFNEMGYRYIDIMDAFNDSNIEELFYGHYSPLANRLVATYILRNL